MPEGVVHWFDAAHGDAEVLREGRAYHVPAGEIEAAARHPGARVHFDLQRVEGVEQAADVRLRQSARASRHRHRFGTLEGARRFDTKGPEPYASVHPELRLAAVHPMQVARSWATSVSKGDMDGALALYSPVAVVHVGERVLEDRTALSEWLEESPAFGCERHARILGRGDQVIVTWEAETPGEQGFAVRCRIAHGEIAEQWLLDTAEVAVTSVEAEGLPPLSMYATGDVDERDKEHAQQVVSRLVEALEEPVLFARVKLVRDTDPARPSPNHAEAMLDLNGEPLRAHAAARTMEEALDALEHRLRERLEHRARRRDELRRSEAIARPGEWRHGDLPPERPPYFDRPPEERQLVRHKTFAVGALTPDEAIFDMVQLDYDFYLFVDLASGIDSIVERTDAGTYRMTRLRPSGVGLGPTAEPVELSDVEVPVLGLQEAIERLGASGERYLFFADAASGRGVVLYLRYDGNYGLIVPE
ncbi:MAG: sigma 54 modulation/S30EA ribosomal C-terminal domain-containing protein [Actinomycetota bacterium]|jgi:ribosome-associated translation inhibitor RaiA|nr:sigma 54 modulation/S30EA ribosomal C-terminal domain-containing protein [Actinomycetota bacterium]